MLQLKLGATGLKVSALALGCLNFGSRTGRRDSYRLLDQYVDAGGAFLDTANNYAFWNEGCLGGESESLLGQWMKDRGNRDQMFIATKAGAKPSYPGALNSAYTRKDVSIPESYARSESLSRLQMLEEIAAETGGTLNQIVLAWMLQSAPAVIPVIAASTPEQLGENLGALEISLSQEQLEKLNQA
ncbi:aldo/keto reductase [Fontibacillus sp. BL9]|uniref:aldo/keto reductase n=1 Tax=Fontibacillus sp. BL9 TaxID=3389971 RepID=UPI003979C56D